jgi:ubiquinone/menaquinone biosynthesis C-methylase UbiE
MSGETVDAVVVSRLFLIVQEREAVLGEIHRVLKPGGKCFVAEPTTPLKTRLPLWFMRALSRLSGDERRSHPHQGDARVLSRAEFGSMVHSQPWAQVEETKQRGYQYAICTKAAAAMPDFTRSAA